MSSRSDQYSDRRDTIRGEDGKRLRKSTGNRHARLARLSRIALSCATVAISAISAISATSAISAISATSGAAQTEPLLDACSLLTPGDAREILGGEVSPETTSVIQGSGETVSQCAYASAHSRRFLSLLVRQSMPAARADAAYDRARAMAKALTGSDPVDVSGVGEKAYWTGGTFRQLTVLAKGVQLIVNVDLGDGRDRIAGTKAVARKALSRM
jgi:hypothetical protein